MAEEKAEDTVELDETKLESSKKSKDTSVSAEMEAAAKAQHKEMLAKAAEKEAAGDDLSTPRTRKRGYRSMELWIDETLPLEIDLDLLSPTSYLTKPHGEITGLTDTQEFTIIEERLKGLTFQMPGLNLPQKRQYTVKAIHQDGRLVQLPFEEQIQNTAGGDIQDAIGLRRYSRKGITVLIDWNTLMPVYCAAWGCWAAAMREELIERFPQNRDAIGTGFCSVRHARHTMPNMFRDAGAILGGLFGENATTSRVWEAPGR